MDHGPAVRMGKDNASEFKKQLGIILFIIYALIYAGFVAINTIAPKLMETQVFLGLNMAVVYGFGLILLAIVLGMVYNAVCTQKENELNNDSDKKESKGADA